MTDLYENKESFFNVFVYAQQSVSEDLFLLIKISS